MRSAYGNGDYLREHPTWHAEDSPWKAQQVYAMLQRHRITPLLIGDSGCGAGDVLRCMSQYFPAATLRGYDVSPQAYRLAVERATERLTFYNTSLSSEPLVFDVVLALDVVEHVEDCFGFARSMLSHAKWFVFHFPLDLSCHALLRNVLMVNRRAMGHIHYFTRHTAIAFLQECGYTIVAADLVRPPAGWRTSGIVSRVTASLRTLGLRIAPAATATTLGGISLLVLARSHEQQHVLPGA
jgi:hypothetical protein